MTVTKAIDLPVGGYAKIEWAPGDHRRFRQIMTRLYTRQRLTAYKLDKHYRFETSESTLGERTNGHPTITPKKQIANQ